MWKEKKDEKKFLKYWKGKDMKRIYIEISYEREKRKREEKGK